MKRKLTIFLATVSIVIAITVMWYNTPVRFLTNIKPDKVSYIKVQYGGTGSQFTIDNKDDVTHIVYNIQSVTLKRDGISQFRMGYGFRLSFYDDNDKFIDQFIVNGDCCIRDDPFFYNDKTNSLCFDYLLNLEEKLK